MHNLIYFFSFNYINSSILLIINIIINDTFLMTIIAISLKIIIIIVDIIA